MNWEFSRPTHTDFCQHKSEVHPGLRVYKYCPDNAAIQIRGTRGNTPTIATTHLTWQEVAELRDYLTALLEEQK